jgi:hypothetical protein
MMQYNKALQKASVLLALDGLFPPSTGARISYADGKLTVTDGPFAETNQIARARAALVRCGTFLTRFTVQ